MNPPLAHPCGHPAPDLPEPQIQHYLRWLRATSGLQFDSYDALWQWSVDDLRGFWRSIWDYFDIQSATPVTSVLDEEKMPGARWFEGARINWAAQVLRHVDVQHAAGCPAMVFADENLLARGQLQELSWPALRAQVARAAQALRDMGVQPGDRVVGLLPNRPETAVVFLAAASIGALWSLCSPDMGPVAVLDRFRQIEPTLLVAVDGYHFGGVAHDRRAVLDTMLAGLPSLRHVWLWPLLDEAADPQALAAPGRAAHDLRSLLATPVAGEDHFTPEPLPFDHPLWVVYSSGTTGLPKAIVHGHGGVMLEMLKGNTLHNNLGAGAAVGERFHWYSSTGWIMWNCQIGGLLGGTTVCLFDGSPACPADPSVPGGAPDWTTLWRFAAQAGATFFGAGAAFYASCLKAGVKPLEAGDLSALRSIGSTGSPLSEDCYRWIWDHGPKPGGDNIFIATISGGTDFAGAFIAGLPTLPTIAGEMQCRGLGAAVQAFDEAGRPVMGEVGELVCVKPMPSMPQRLWGDEDGSRLRDSYFDMYPGVWRHGDWIRLIPHPESGNTGAIIYGRSDATINRHGVRMGTAELYRAVEALPEVLDSLVVDLEYLGRPGWAPGGSQGQPEPPRAAGAGGDRGLQTISWMPLFVVLREGFTLDAALASRIKDEVKKALSPRHVPNDVFQVPAIPRTLSGKKMELPVKKLLMGADPSQVMNRDAMANAAAVDWFADLARQRAAKLP